MPNIKLYIATSLDGKIARQDGDVSWLDEIPNPNKTDYDYYKFYDSIEATIMGNKSYQKVLSFGVAFPYKEKQNYVLTRKKAVDNDENVTFVDGDIPAFVRDLKTKLKKDIWLVGGGEIISLFLQHQLIDEIQLFLMPVVIGEGIPLLPKLDKDYPLTLINSKAWESGVVELNYKLT